LYSKYNHMMLVRNERTANLCKVPNKTPKALNPEVAAAIRHHRKSAGLTQTAMAVHVGVSYQAYQKYELGKATVPIRTLLLIAEHLGVAPHNFLPQQRKRANPGLGDELTADVGSVTLEEYSLLREYRRIQSKKHRSIVTLIAKSFADQEVMQTGKGADQAH
jgi:transcriptional regulator with XRE-family HTH domain